MGAAGDAGDAVAFTRIVAAYHGDMTRVAYVVSGGDQDIADDAVQTAWSVAWRKLGSLRDPDRLKPGLAVRPPHVGPWAVRGLQEVPGLLQALDEGGPEHRRDRAVEEAKRSLRRERLGLADERPIPCRGDRVLEGAVRPRRDERLLEAPVRVHVRHLGPDRHPDAGRHRYDLPPARAHDGRPGLDLLELRDGRRRRVVALVLEVGEELEDDEWRVADGGREIEVHARHPTPTRQVWVGRNGPATAAPPVRLPLSRPGAPLRPGLR